MTQEEKELLHRDLSSRLPYKVKCYNSKYRQDLAEEIICITINNNHNCVQLGTFLFKLEDVKPYLFPLSSMTEEQKKELFKYCEFYIQENGEGKNEEVYGIEIARRPDPAYCYDHTFRIWGIDMRAINWLLKNHFDIYGLIPMDLAIDATGLNIY